MKAMPTVLLRKLIVPIMVPSSRSVLFPEET